ncbi:MAG: NAD(P)-dependent oxidoreductase [Fulvivirga sp.]
MKVALFGHSGYIGTALYNKLSAQYKVTGISRSLTGVGREISLDITSEDSFSKLDCNFDSVVICSAQLPTSNYTAEYFKSLVEVNIQGVQNIMTWLKGTTVRKVIFCSTLAVIDDGVFEKGEVSEDTLVFNTSRHYPYTMSKLAGEQIINAVCSQMSIGYNILRLSSVYGSKMTEQGVVLNFYKKTLENKSIDISNAQYNADFIHIENVVNSIETCLNIDTYNGVINIASGQPITLLELAQVCKTVNRSTSQIEILNTKKVPLKKYNNSLMKRLLGVENIIELKEGIKSIEV